MISAVLNDEHVEDNDWSSHVMNGEAYVAETLVFGVAGRPSIIQMFNPVGSGRRVRIRCIEPMAFLAIPINLNIRRYDTPVLTLGGLFGVVENLLGGGGASVVTFRYDNPLLVVGSVFWLFLSSGNTRWDYPHSDNEWGHDLLPGQGVLLTGGLGTFSIVGWMWAEVPL